MAKVEWADAIKTVSGALVKINKKSPHAADQKMILATHRVAATTSNKCNNLYLRGLGSITRSTPVTQNEMVARQRFSAVAALVKARAVDLQKMSADQANFAAQKDNPGGAKTLKKYYWRICGQEYDASQG